MRYVIYLMIGIGSLAGLERGSEEQLDPVAKAVLVLAWPAMATAFLVDSAKIYARRTRP